MLRGVTSLRLMATSALPTVPLSLSLLRGGANNKKNNGLTASSLLRHQSTFLAASVSSTSNCDSETGYLAVHVRGRVNPGDSNINNFFENTLTNAKQSVQEPGISRFDVCYGNDGEFLLIEVYNSKTGPDEHKKTAHYEKWRDAVAPLMNRPREAKKYMTLFPPTPAGWATPVPQASEMDRDNSLILRSSTLSAVERGGEEPSYPNMLAVIVDIQVVPGTEEEFIQASRINCENSLLEPGVHRFDLLQNTEDRHNFALVEVYNSAQAPLDHKATNHYAKWADTVKGMMARPRSATKYRSLFPAPLFWHNSASYTHLGHGSYGKWSSVGLTGVGLSSVTAGSFSFLSPKITMGKGIAAKAIVGALKENNIRKPLIITGKSGMGRYPDLFAAIKGQCPLYTVYSVGGEPTVEDASEATQLAMANGCDGVLSLGGGSAIDLGKAVSALTTNLGTMVDGQPSTIYTYLEVVGEGKAIQNRPIPMIAVPTTSGTGSEATKNAVLKSNEFGRKASIRHDSMLPVSAVVDPLLTASCPPDVTAHVGLDALCQCIEPFVSNMVNPMVDAIAREGILRASRSLRLAVADGQADMAAREDMSVASLFGGLSLANAKLGAVHGYAAVLGGMFERSPHGAICAALLPAVFRRNAERLASLAEKEGGMATEKGREALSRLERFNEVAKIVTGNPSANALEGAAWLEALVRDLRVPKLSYLLSSEMDVESKVVIPIILTDSQVKEIAAATAGSSSTKGNPIVLSESDLEDILRKSL